MCELGFASSQGESISSSFIIEVILEGKFNFGFSTVDGKDEGSI